VITRIVDVSGLVLELDPRPGFVALGSYDPRETPSEVSRLASLTYEQAQELHRALGIALGDERVRRAELERSKGK
jgi:hypothetical protein